MPKRKRREDVPHRAEAARLTVILRKGREARGISQQTLAVAADVSIGTVRAIETGRTVDPGLFTVVRLAAGLGLDMASVLRELSSPDGE